METGKTTKYFKYAIGEIILVVIGILIALQINNWNENKKNNARKKDILKEIHLEFVTNKSKLEYIVERHKECYVAAQKTVNMFPINLNTVNLDTFRISIIKSFGNWTYEPLQTRIKTFVSSTDFNLVKDKDLQEILISWESIYEDFHEDEQGATKYNYNHLYPYLNKYFPTGFKMNDPRFDKSILQSIEFENKIRTRLRTLNDILYNETNELDILAKTIQKIITLTEPYATKK